MVGAGGNDAAPTDERRAYRVFGGKRVPLSPTTPHSRQTDTCLSYINLNTRNLSTESSL